MSADRITQIHFPSDVTKKSASEAWQSMQSASIKVLGSARLELLPVESAPAETSNGQNHGRTKPGISVLNFNKLGVRSVRTPTLLHVTEVQERGHYCFQPLGKRTQIYRWRLVMVGVALLRDGGRLGVGSEGPGLP